MIQEVVFLGSTVISFKTGIILKKMFKINVFNIMAFVVIPLFIATIVLAIITPIVAVVVVILIVIVIVIIIVLIVLVYTGVFSIRNITLTAGDSLPPR